MDSPGRRDQERLPFDLHQCPDLGRLRQALEAASYTEESVGRTVLMEGSGTPFDLAAAVRRTVEPSPYNTLVRLFVLACAVDEAAARAALAPADVEQLVAVGLLRRAEDGLRAAATLLPLEDLLIARDFWPDFTRRPMTADFVIGVGLASRQAASLTVRRRGERALDLGTGCGYLALLEARHADHVVATDINARALNFAALNARLNGLANVEFRQGSLYDPVADDGFDLIVCNPPYVISPESRYEYRDGGLPGDALSERVIRGAPARLREGGFCTVLLDWHHRGDDDWADRPLQWTEGGGCDAWLLRFRHRDPLAYAATWLRPEAGDDPAAHARQLDEWLAYYERLGLRRISSGAVILHRRSAKANWTHAEEAPASEELAPCSGQIQRIFAAHDLLQALGGEAGLLDCAFALAPDHRLEHTLRAEDGRWMIQAARLRQAEGLPFVGNVDRWVCTILAGCDGQRTLRELVADLAAALHADPQRLGSACTALFRKLLEAGFLTVAAPPQRG